MKLINVEGMKILKALGEPKPSPHYAELAAAFRTQGQPVNDDDYEFMDDFCETDNLG
jgi:hypothetical protein